MQAEYEERFRSMQSEMEKRQGELKEAQETIRSAFRLIAVFQRKTVHVQKKKTIDLTENILSLKRVSGRATSKKW